SPVNYPVGPTPVAIVTGDFNGDGKLDLAVTNADGSAAGNDIVSILLGNGDGTFQAAVNYKVGLNPISIAVADLNLDNKQDIAVAFHGSVGTGQTGGVSLLLGNGDGTFQPAINLASNDYPQGIVAGGFNGDHQTDLAVSNFLNIDASVNVFIGNGDGTLRSADQYVLTGDPASIAAGDFNGDGHQDLVTTAETRSNSSDGLDANASVLLGNGNGSFQSPVETELGGGAGEISIADLNRDGHLDLATFIRPNVFAKPSLKIFSGLGDGTFGSGVSVDDPSFRDSFVTIADLNTDGIPDLLVLGSTPQAAHVWLGQGNGTFKLAQTVAFSNLFPASAVIRDFNGDLLPDLAVTMNVTSPPGFVAILLNSTTDFTLSASPLNPVMVSAGGSATSMLSLGAANGFNGSITLGCTVQPQPAVAPHCS